MKVATSRFGEIEVAPEALVTFPDGLPGFEDKRFVLLPAPEAPRVVWLQSISSPDLALMTVDPRELAVEYAPRFKPAETRGVTGDREVALECRVVARADGDGGVRLNLFAPLLFNRDAGLAVQLALVGSGYATDTPWPAPAGSDTVPEP